MLKGMFRAISYACKGFFVDVPHIVKSPSYFPEKPRKKACKRYFDNVAWLIRKKEVNDFYNLYGMDVKGCHQFKQDYIGHYEFRKTRNRLNNAYRHPYNYLVLLRDKFVFANYLENLGFPVARNLAVSINGVITSDKKEIAFTDLPNLCDETGLFVKVTDGECADGVWHLFYKNTKWIDNTNCEVDLKKILAEHSIIIFQKTIIQHPTLAKLNPASVNTLRICTCATDKGIEILEAGLRIGTSSLAVDNWATGGVFIGIDANGCLKKNAFYKPCCQSKKIAEHPLSHIVFEGYEIPYYQEAIALVKQVHTCFYDLFAIGWDVAITESGPVLVEGNDNFETTLMQVASGGLKTKWQDYANRHSKMKMRF